MTNHAENLFTCLAEIRIYIFGKMFVQIVVPFKKKNYIVNLPITEFLSFKSPLQTLYISSLPYAFYKYFLEDGGLSLYLLRSFLQIFYFNFNIVQISIFFSFIDHDFGVIYKNSSPNPRSLSYLLLLLLFLIKNLLKCSLQNSHIPSTFIINITQQNGNFLTKDGSTLTYNNHPKSTVYIIVYP